MYMRVCFDKAIFHYTKEVNLQAALRHVVNCYIKYVRLCYNTIVVVFINVLTM